MKFLMFNDDFWNHPEIEKLSKANIFALIRLLYISFEWKHNIFFRTQDQILSELKLDRMGFFRFKNEMAELKIKIYKTNQKYYFNLTKFFEEFNPISNKNVTKSCNENVTN